VAKCRIVSIVLLGACSFISASAQTTAPAGCSSERLAESKDASRTANEVSPTAAANDQVVRQFTDDKLAVWRQRLKLEDWRISIVRTRLSDLPPKTMGGIRWDKTRKTAVIWVLDPADYRLPFREMLDDMELTIVHELVHLDIASLPHSEAHRGSEEHAVSGIAEAMLRLDREKQ
jgi:hypothetical protein